MSDSGEKQLRDAPATFSFSFYNINWTNKISVFMYVIYAFCILQLDRYRDVPLYVL